MNSNKLRYKEFISNFEDISVFSQPWWLDLVCGPDNWDVALVERDGRPVATLPYFIKKKWFLKVLTQPPLTQVIEPLFAVKPENDSDKKSKLMSELI